MSHVNIGKQYPTAYKALMQLNHTVMAAAAEAGLSERLFELVKIRASQLNGCAFCLRMHARDGSQSHRTWRPTCSYGRLQRDGVAPIGQGGAPGGGPGRTRCTMHTAAL